MREIARDAGVTAMMVNRYFGTKENLFAEAVEAAFAPPVFVPDRSDAVARDVASALVARTERGADSPEAFLIMLRSVSDPRAVEIVRDAIERHSGARLGRQLPEPGATIRTDLMLSVIAGVVLMRRVITLRGLDEASPEPLTGVLAAVLGAIVDAPGV